MNNTDRENGTMAGPLIFTVPAYGVVMALYLDCLRRTPTRERLPITGVERTRKRRSVFEWFVKPPLIDAPSKSSPVDGNAHLVPLCLLDRKGFSAAPSRQVCGRGRSRCGP